MRSLTRSLTRQRRCSCLPLGCCSGSDWPDPSIQRRLLLIPPLWAELAGRDPGTSRRQVTLPNIPDGRRPNYAPLDAPQLMNSNCSELLLPVWSDRSIWWVMRSTDARQTFRITRDSNKLDGLLPAEGASAPCSRRSTAVIWINPCFVGLVCWFSPTNRSRFSCSVRIEVTTAGKREPGYLLVIKTKPFCPLLLPPRPGWSPLPPPMG